MKVNHQKKFKKENGFDKANIFSRLLYTWGAKYLLEGNRRELTDDDVCEPMRNHKASYCEKKMKKAWDEEERRCKITGAKPKLMRAILRAYGPKYVRIFVSTLIMEMLPFLQMYTLYGLLVFFSNKSKGPDSYQNAVYNAAGLFIFTFFRSNFMHFCILRASLLGMNARLAVNTLLYQKVLQLNKTKKSAISTGFIINLFAGDGKKVEGLFSALSYLIISPLQCIAASTITYFILGWPAILGGVFSLAFYPMQFWIGRLCSRARNEVIKKADSRVRIMNEIISGMNVLKMYAWEDPFSELIYNARKDELRSVRKSNVTRALGFLCLLLRPRTAILLILASYVLFIGDIDAIKVYMALALQNLYHPPMSLLFTKAGIHTGEARLSFRRITDFLLSDETDDFQGSGSAAQEVDIVENEINSLNLISIKGMSACWSANQGVPTLMDVSLEFRRGEFTAIVGSVGSGKSSLLYAIMGEMIVTKGFVHVSGSLSYAAQEPWVFQGSLRDNVVFGNSFDSDRYQEVIKVCALERDIAMLPEGDSTIVGERGARLSGGQKARVGLARAVYRNADVYLMDDPLAAVDVGVGKHILEECIKSFLKEKTVILVTHQKHVLESVGKIIWLENGLVKNVSLSNEIPDVISEQNETEEEFTENDENENKANDTQTKPSMESENKMFESETGTFLIYLTSGGPWWSITLLILLYFIAQSLGSFYDLLLNHWVNVEDHVLQIESALTNIGGNQNRSDSPSISLPSHLDGTIELCLIILTVSLICLVTFTISATVYIANFLTAAANTLHNNMFNAVMRTTMSFFNNNTSGRILNRFSNELQIVDEILSDRIIECIPVLLYVFGAALMVMIINPFMIIVFIICIIVGFWLKRLYTKTSSQLKKLESSSRSPVIAHVNQTLNGLTTIRAFNAQQYQTSEFYKYQDHNAGAQYLFESTGATFGYWIEILSWSFILLSLTSIFILPKVEMKAGNVGLVVTQLISLNALIQHVVKIIVDIENSLTSVERVAEYSQLPSEPNWKGSDANDVLWSQNGKIRISNLTFRYNQDGPAILENLNFIVMPQEKIGIVGRTGAGKSSLILALLRMGIVEGTIEIDEIDTKTIPLQELRSSISIIPQDPIIFSGSLRRNIDPFNKYTDDALWKALEEVELKEMVRLLPDGLDTPISEGGGNLSVGQKQLVCLARAIVRNNKILVLDEATANVDHETDALIQKTIRVKFSDTTVLTVAHRLNTVMDYDKIIVISNGNVVEFGQPHELLQNEIGNFREMVAKCGKPIETQLREIAEKNFIKKVNLPEGD